MMNKSTNTYFGDKEVWFTASVDSRSLLSKVLLIFPYGVGWTPPERLVRKLGFQGKNTSVN